MTRVSAISWFLPFLFVLARAAEAGQGATPSAAGVVTIDGPAPPLAPEVVSRDDLGRATIRAVGVNSPMRVDGRLDEAFYDAIPPISGFIQIEPNDGEPATERTEVWLMFDRDRIYISFRCWESQPERMVANEMRRDNPIIFSPVSDGIGFMLDTFYDRRSGVIFNVNPVGGRTDGQVASERQYIGDWNPIWEASVGRFDGGWTIEAAIPFKSLRYRPGPTQVWGFQVRRNNAWKNEVSFLTRVPPGRGANAIMQVGLAATVVGLEVPPRSMNLEIKPYINANLSTDLNADPKVFNRPGGDIGVDVKYGLTQNLTADFTYNTDFAQVEADEQQINLTRFSLFFPEKREFFLENQGTFSFGGASTTASGDTPVLFYSRRIGVNQGRALPLEAGGRLTGRLGRYSIGALNIRVDEDSISKLPATDFSVLRLKRDLLRRSSMGVMFTRRSVGQNGTGPNLAYGLDGTFAFFTNLYVNTYWAQTQTEGLTGQGTSYRSQLDYTGDRYGIQIERLVVGDNFNPEAGFTRRDNIRRSFGSFRFSPRPQSSRLVRKLSWTASLAYLENGAGQLETRDSNGEFAIEFHNSDRLSVAYAGHHEVLTRQFTFPSAVTIPAGVYDYGSVRTVYTLGTRRTLSGNLSMEYGTFYNGDIKTIGLSRGRLTLTSKVSVEPSASVNWVNLVEGSFVSRLAGSRVTYTVTPLMFISALLQYSSDTNTMTSNIRLRWEYQAGSELFVVYNEQRNTLTAGGIPTLANRAIIVKMNRLLRF